MDTFVLLSSGSEQDEAVLPGLLDVAGSLGDILKLVFGRDREQLGPLSGEINGKSEVFRALLRRERGPLRHHQATDMGVAHGKRQSVRLQRLSGQVAISDQ